MSVRTKARDSGVMDRIGRYDQSMRGSAPRERVCDQSYIKQFNIQSVLATLRRHQPISRTDIACLTGMSPTSITRIVTALLNQDLIYETTGDPRSGRGRKATNLKINAGGLYSIGIHLERSLVRMCMMNLADEKLCRGEALVDGECTPDNMARTAKTLMDRMTKDVIRDSGRIGAVGVCLPGAVNKWAGVLNKSWQLKWENVDLAAVFSREFGVPACIENDVKACLIGEKVRMGIPDEVDTAYLLVGAGIGLACTSGGALVRGVDNAAGNISSIPIGRLPDGQLDYLPRHLREGALIDRARGFDPGICSVDAILRAQQQGQAWAEALIEDFRSYLEIAVRMIDGIYNPAKIILGGTICSRLYPNIAEKLNSDIVCMGTHYEDSCTTGAAMIAMRSALIDRIAQSIE